MLSLEVVFFVDFSRQILSKKCPQPPCPRCLPARSNVYLYSAIEPGGPLEIFLSQRCARSMHFALRLWWLLDAEVGDNKPATVQRCGRGFANGSPKPWSTG